jgi:hypothetical protein
MKISRKTIIILAVSAVIYFFYVYDLSRNPPGFYIDETLASYNAYLLSQTGRGEFGHLLPLYFPVLKIPPPHDYLGWVDPVQIYSMAALYLVFPPGYLLPRLLSATAMFFACFLLGRLAYRVSDSLLIGAVAFFTALVNPWLFETGRLAFGASLYPFAVAVLLTAIYSASRKEKWSLLNVAAIGASLGLVTYTYSIGRLLGPLLALGLIVFATSIAKFKDVFKAWVAYGITLIPMVIFHFQNPGALAGRFNMTVGIAGPDKGWSDVLLEFLKNYAANISPYKMLFEGDPNLRHHIFNTGAIYVPTLLLAIAGIVLIILIHRKEAWWRYVLFGLIASVIPASLTRDQFHMLRLIAFPVFLFTLTVPAVMWLIGRIKERADAAGESGQRLVVIRQSILALLMVLTLVQAFNFYTMFRKEGPTRGLWFDESYPRLVQAALAMPDRPIHLVDGYWGQAYAHAYWYGIVHSLDPGTFVRVKEGSQPPPGAIVISSEDKCTNCEMIRKDDPFLLYRKRAVPQPAQPQPAR